MKFIRETFDTFDRLANTILAADPLPNKPGALTR